MGGRLPLTTILPGAAALSNGSVHAWLSLAQRAVTLHSVMSSGFSEHVSHTHESGIGFLPQYWQP